MIVTGFDVMTNVQGHIALVGMMLLGAARAQSSSSKTTETTLTRETVESLLQILSPRCKLALEAALDSQLELSDACKAEIRSAIPKLSIGVPQLEQVDDASGAWSSSQQQPIPPTSSRSNVISNGSDMSSFNGIANAVNAFIQLVLSDHYYAGMAAVIIFIVVVLASLLVVRLRKPRNRPSTSKKNKKSELQLFLVAV